MLVTENVLTAEEHLQLGVGQVGAQLTQALPRIFVQKTHTGVKCSAAPTFQRVVANRIEHFTGREHIFKRHACGGLRLMGIAQDGIGDQKGLVGQKFHKDWFLSTLCICRVDAEGGQR